MRFDYLEHLTSRARGLVNDSWDAIEDVAGILLLTKSISGDQARTIFRWHSNYGQKARR